MDAVETRHEVHAEHRQSFWTKYIFSQDHKIIGIQYALTSMVMAVLGGFLAMFIRLQLGWPGASWPLLGRLFPGGMPDGQVSPAFYLSSVTMHGTIMIFFVLTTLLTGGFGNYLIPLMTGARDMAFPFLNMLSYWLYPPAIIVLLASFFVSGGAAGGGWTAYPPLSALPQAAPGSGLGQTLWLISLALLIVAFLFGSLNYITTVLQLRTRGMSMMRMPLTIWSLFITAILALFAFPVLLAAAVMLLFDRLGGTSFFVPAGLIVGSVPVDHRGGSPLLWQHLFWFLGHPEVYVLILPPMGMVSDIIANHARKPIFGYRAMVAAIAAIAFLSFLVWGHHMYTSGMHPLLGTAFMTTTLIIAVPSAIKTFNWLATLWRARIRFTTPMLFALGFLSLFVTGGLTGLVLGQPPIDIYFQDTFFVVAHFHFVMGLAAFFAAFAGTYHWFPKMFGRMMDERLGKWHFWLSFIAAYAAFFPMHYLGFRGFMRRIYNYAAYEHLQGLQGMNIFISIAAFVLFAAQLIFLYNFVRSLFRGQKAEANPWQATTLEWQTPTVVPPHGNWGATLPTVHRWAYDYSVPGAADDYVPQTVPAAPVPVGDGETRRGDGGSG